MLRRLYDWILGHAGRPHAVWTMAAISFTESSFFPIVPDILLIPMMVADRRRSFWYATVATVSSVLGGFLGYAIGFFLFGTVGHFLIDLLSSPAQFAQAQAMFDRWGFWLIVGKGLTPIPYKIVTILCGFLHYDLARFALASTLARGLRFYPEAALFYYFGNSVRDFIERRLVWVTSGVAVAVVGLVVAVKLI